MTLRIVLVCWTQLMWRSLHNLVVVPADRHSEEVFTAVGYNTLNLSPRVEGHASV